MLGFYPYLLMPEPFEEKIENYANIRKKYAELYADFDKVHCPALGNDFVHFTSTGFNHLVYSKLMKQRKKLREEIPRRE